MIGRVIRGFVVLFAVLFLGGAIWVASRQHLVFDAPYPRIDTSPVSARLARGRYVVRVAADCAGCHGDPAQSAALRAGVDVPMTGGAEWNIPPGVFHALNITPDPETGIGALPDSTIARALRYGVGRDGRALLPFMNKQGMSDEDLGAVIAYIKHQPPVKKAVPPHRYTLLGMVVKATVLAKAVGPSSTPPARSPRGATIENGKYLVEVLTDCGGCHTARDMRTGAMIGQPFAGTANFEGGDSTGSWSPPNITAGGRLATMSEDQFVARFRAGRAFPRSPMPWQAFQQLEEDDLRAIYRYLMSVPRSAADVGPAFVPRAKS